MENDIAVIRLKKDIKYKKDSVGPVCLGRKSDGDFDSDEVTAMGWGTTSENGPSVRTSTQISLLALNTNSVDSVFFTGHQFLKH